MNTRTTCFTLLVSLLTAALPARAQQVTNLPKGTQQSVALEAGFDSSFIARATYQHAVPGFLKDATVYGRFTLPVVEPDLEDFAADMGVSATAIGNDRWKLHLLLGPVLRNTSNLLFSGTALGLRSGLLAGYRSDGWGLMAEV